MQDREEYLDILRALSCIGVIIIHVSAQNWYENIGSFNWYVFTFYETIARVSVPLFFMISGCLMLRREYSIKALYKKILKLVVFLIVWAVIYKFVQLPSEGGRLQNYFYAAKEIIYGNTQPHLWYIYAAIGLYLITPALAVFCRNSDKQTILYTIIICFILGSMYDLLIQFDVFKVITNNMAKIESGYGVGFINYYLLGYYLDRYREDFNGWVCFIGGVSGLISTGLIIWDCTSSQTYSERFMIYTMPFIVISSIAGFVFVQKQSDKINGKIKKALLCISDRSLGIYGVHFLIIMMIWRFGFTTVSFNALLSVPLISFIVLISSFGTSYLLGKIPIAGKYMA